MKLQVLQENLSKAISNATRFANSRAQLPVLGNILFSTKKTKLLVASTNLEISIAEWIGAKIEEEGDITIPARTISDIVSNLPSGPVSIESQKEQMTIKSQNYSLSALGINSSDFPTIPTSVDPKNSVSFQKDEILEALTLVTFATSSDETRPILTGVLFLFDKNTLTLVATDGFRLSRKKIKIQSPLKLDLAQVIVPRNVLNEISRLAEEDLIFSFSKKENQALFQTGERVVSSRILEGNFPDYEKIIPKSSSTTIYADKQEVIRAVKLAAVFARDSANIVKFIIEKGNIVLTSESHTTGNQKATVDAKVEGENLEVAFNFHYLEDILNALKEDEVKMEFSGSNSPGVFTNPKDTNYLHLIMPVRISS